MFSRRLLILKGEILSLQGLGPSDTTLHIWDQGWNDLPARLQTWGASPQEVDLYVGGDGNVWTWESFSPLLGWIDRIRLFRARKAFLRKSMGFWALIGCFWNPRESLSVGCVLSQPLRSLVLALKGSPGIADLKVYSLAVERAGLVYEWARHNGCLFSEKTLTVVVFQESSSGSPEFLAHFVFWGRVPLFTRTPGYEGETSLNGEDPLDTEGTEDTLKKAALETAAYVGRWSPDLNTSSPNVFFLRSPFGQEQVNDLKGFDVLDLALLKRQASTASPVGPLTENGSFFQKFSAWIRTFQAPVRQNKFLKRAALVLIGGLYFEGVLLQKIWEAVGQMRTKIPVLQKQIQEGHAWEASLPVAFSEAQRLLKEEAERDLSLLCLQKVQDLIQPPVECQKILWRRLRPGHYWMRLWVFESSRRLEESGVEDSTTFNESNDQTWESWKASLQDLFPGAQLVRSASPRHSPGPRSPPLWELTVRWSDEESRERVSSQKERMNILGSKIF